MHAFFNYTDNNALTSCVPSGRPSHALVPAELQGIRIISIIQVADITRGDELTEVGVPGLGIDGVGGVVFLQPLRCGLREEVKDGFPLFQDRQGIVSIAEPLHQPRSIKGAQKPSGTP